MKHPTPKSGSAWHALSPPDLLTRLSTNEGGLTSAEAQARLDRYGPNRLPQKPPPAWWQIALRQFKSPLIYILMLAAFVSLLIHPDDPVDAIFITAVLILNAVIGGYQEWRAERSSRALQQLLQIRATVLRDGEVCEIDAEELVPGDVVWLEPGNRVPADLRLLMSHGLEIDESLLTGESLPVAKNPALVSTPETTMADRQNMAFAGSIVAHGRGRGVVVSTAEATAVGQLALDVLSGAGGQPPLIERMEKFTRGIAYAVLASATIIALIGILLRGYTIGEMFMFSVALAVSAIPEGLPVALTVALAVATTRMARRRVIVRRLAAVEGLGSCTFIGSDKTGTLTCNELTVRALVLPDGQRLDVSGEGFVPDGAVLRAGRPVAPGGDAALSVLARAAVLCNEAHLHQRDGVWVWHGDPTDLALLSLGHKLGLVREELLVQYPQVNEIPFEPERQYAATFHQFPDEVRACVKGAPERVLPMCVIADSRSEMRDLLAQAAAMAGCGYRVLALAEGAAPADLDGTCVPVEPARLTFLGFVGMIDPLRPGVREAVAACHAAGITVSMITGDHPVTALAIARDLGFAERPDKVIYLLVSTGAAEVLLLGLVVLSGWPRGSDGLAILPLLAVQLLWLNLVTNGIQDIALAFEPGEAGVLQRRPRPPYERVFNRLMIERTLVAAVVMASVGFAAFAWMIEVAGWAETQARSTLLLLMVLFENIHIANCRSETTSAFWLSPFTSPILLGGTILAFSIHLAAMHLPITQAVLQIAPVDLTTFAVLLALASTILVAIEIHKWSWRLRHPKHAVEQATA